MSLFRLGSWRRRALHSGQNLFRTACARSTHSKGAEQARHGFQNGYDRRRLPCHLFGELEPPPGATPDDASMISADDLVRVVGLDSIGGVVVVVDVQSLDWLPCVGVMGDIVAQCEMSSSCFTVRLPLSIDQDFRVVAQASIEPHQNVPNLPSGILDGADEPMERPRPTERDEMRAGLGDPQRFGPERFARHPMVPLAAHEAQTIRRVTHDGVDALGVHRGHDLATVADVEGVRQGHAAAPFCTAIRWRIHILRVLR